ncbi:MAG: hypothetical protein ACOYXB_09165 [Bacteroidota bacterium]
MRKLLHAEQIKLLSYTPFRILIILYFVFFSLGILIYPAIDKQIPMISITDLFRFPDIWPFLAWITEPYNILLSLIIIMITCSEFSNHTFKTSVIFGMSRSELLLQKMMAVLILSVFATLLVGITSFSLGMIYSYKLTLNLILENTWVMALYFLEAFSYMTIALFFAFLIRNTALTLISFLAFRVLVEPAIRLLLKDYDVRLYFPFKTISRLNPLPDLMAIFQQKMNSGPDGEVPPDANFLGKALPLWADVLLVIGYVSLFLFLSHRIINRRKLS